MVYILIQIDNITFIHRYKVCYSANMPGLSGTVKQQFGCFHHP